MLTECTPATDTAFRRHWRYISSFHGPWLQLPPEVLETLAYTNSLATRPRPIDAAVFFDVVKIRRAVDDATDLAVRAASGLTSSALNNSAQAGNGTLGGAGAAALGIVFGGAGTAKLSKERKHRMRELATQKLSMAYHLDEVATSVATMQSTSSLDDVGQFVLQRNPTDSDAKYVHFFHEKIPSRMMAESTPLDALNQIIADRPGDAAPLRTRALTRIFKEDYAGAIKDLTAALAACRLAEAQHRPRDDQISLAHFDPAAMRRKHGMGWRRNIKLETIEQPSSLEPQLLFHRAGVYFALACQHVPTALDGLKEDLKGPTSTEEGVHPNGNGNIANGTASEAHKRRLEERKMVKMNAKRAIKDYLTYLSFFEYTSGYDDRGPAKVLPSIEGCPSVTEASKIMSEEKLLEEGTTSSGQTSNALVLRKGSNAEIPTSADENMPRAYPRPVYPASALFSAVPLPDIPPYPERRAIHPNHHDETQPGDSRTEEVSYHPLLADALHSMLLCHALSQTPPKELKRHAYNVSRLVRHLDGYPIFLAARSPARADWIELLRQTGNWIGLRLSWDLLCRPMPLPDYDPSKTWSYPDGTAFAPAESRSTAVAKSPQRALPEPEKSAAYRERQKQEAIADALADERVVDEESFRRAVRAREMRAAEDDKAKAAIVKLKSAPPAIEAGAAPRKAIAATPATTPDKNGSPSVPADSAGAPQSPPTPAVTAPPTPSSSAPRKRSTQDDGKEYKIMTERAEAIVRWVKEAPLTVEGQSKSKGKRGKGGSKAAKAAAGTAHMKEAFRASNGDLAANDVDDENDAAAGEEEVD